MQPERVRETPGLAAIDDDLANGLAEVVGGTSAFWRKRQATYERCLSKAADTVSAETAKTWLKNIPLSGMISSGWIEQPSQRSLCLRSCLAYFGVTDPDDWHRRYAQVAADVAFRTSPTFKSSLRPLSAWLRQAEIEATMMPCAKWNKDALEASLPQTPEIDSSPRAIEVPSQSQSHLRRVRCRRGGAASFRRDAGQAAPPGFLRPDRAMLALSFRYLSEDHFWFTFFHEIGHLLLHQGDGTFVDIDTSVTDVREREANNFATLTLIPAAKQRDLEYLSGRKMAVIRFAASIGTSPGVVRPDAVSKAFGTG